MRPTFLAYSEAQEARFRKVPSLSFNRAAPYQGERRMETKENIYRQTKSLIPSDLWTRYNNLSYREMAKVSELTAWGTQLRGADRRSSEAGA